MRMDKDLVQQTRLRIEQADRIMVTAHTRPDGDAIGSVLALGLGLQAEGKQVQMVLADGVPNARKAGDLSHPDSITGRGRAPHPRRGAFFLPYW